MSALHMDERRKVSRQWSTILVSNCWSVVSFTDLYALIRILAAPPSYWDSNDCCEGSNECDACKISTNGISRALQSPSNAIHGKLQERLDSPCLPSAARNNRGLRQRGAFLLEIQISSQLKSDSKLPLKFDDGEAHTPY